MRLILLFVLVLFLLCPAISHSQATGGIVAGPTTTIQNAFFSPVAPAAHPDISGSPFLLEEWLLARLQMPDNRVIDSVYIRLNLYDKRLQFKNQQGEEMESSARIKEIRIIDNNPKWKNAIFRTGYEGDANTFFQVLVDGSRMQVLKMLAVNVSESTQIGEGRKRTFQYNDEMFFDISGKLYRSDKKCSNLMSAEIFGTDKVKMLRYISDNNIRCTQLEDARKLADYYNSPEF